jgi:hypothetical protein
MIGVDINQFRTGLVSARKRITGISDSSAPDRIESGRKYTEIFRSSRG